MSASRDYVNQPKERCRKLSDALTSLGGSGHEGGFSVECDRMPAKQCDIVGIGLNAMDVIIDVPHYPAFNSKTEFESADVLPGGQVATAMVACQQWGLKTRYVGRIGDDDLGRLQRESLIAAGVEVSGLKVVPGCRSQSAYIIVDRASGERTILWRRDLKLRMRAEELSREIVCSGRLLHVDGHDTDAVAQAARWAREEGIPVTADIDNIYPRVESLLESIDYLVSSSSFPAKFTGVGDLPDALHMIQESYKQRFTACTLGEDGALGFDGQRYWYCPAYEVRCVDTTGAGDVFHGGFAYASVQGWPPEQALEFASAAAGLSCTARGARGGIASLDAVGELMRTGCWRSIKWPDWLIRQEPPRSKRQAQ